jgi:MOB kinase activator 1
MVHVLNSVPKLHVLPCQLVASMCYNPILACMCVMLTHVLCSLCQNSEYLWKDAGEYKVATKMSAPKYIDLLLGWVSDQISDPKLFPVDESNPLTL